MSRLAKLGSLALLGICLVLPSVPHAQAISETDAPDAVLPEGDPEANFAAKAKAEKAAKAAAVAAEGAIPIDGDGDMFDEANVGRVLLYTESQCVAALRPILDPTAIIAEGLTALNDGPVVNVPACVEEIVTDWEKLIPDPKPSSTFSDDDGESNGFSNEDPKQEALYAKYQKAEQELSCVNTRPPGEKAEEFEKNMNAFCKGKFFPATLKKEKQAARKATRAEYDAYKLEKNIDKELHHLVDVFYPSPKTPRLDALQKQTNCTAQDDPLPAYCKGKKHSKSEISKIYQEMNEIRKKLEPARKLIQKDRNAFSRVLSETKLAAEAFDLAKLKPLNRQLKCLSIDPDEDDDDDVAGMQLFCRRHKLPTKGNATSVKDQIRKLLPDPHPIMDKWKAQEEERKATAAKVKKDRQSENEQKYGLRRLLTHYQRHSRAHPNDSLEAFCRENEAVQKRDLDFALKTNQLSPLSKKGDWKWSGEYGVSEAELSAVKQYTASYYREINAKIWKARAPVEPAALTEADKLFIETLNRGLSQAPAYADRPVKRFSTLPPEALAAHAVGAIVTYDAFTSTSKRTDWQWQSGDRGDAHSFLIYGGKNGVDVNEVSSNEGEGEVLFKAGTRFKVLSKKERRPGSGVFDFVMAEVDEAGNIVAQRPPEP